MDCIYEAKYNEPFVFLSSEKNTFEILGNSYSCNVQRIFEKIINWVDTELSRMRGKLKCKFHLSGVNSDTKYYVTSVLIKLNEYRTNGTDMEFIWCYDEDDEDVLSIGLNLIELYNIPVQIIEK